MNHGSGIEDSSLDLTLAGGGVFGRCQERNLGLLLAVCVTCTNLRVCGPVAFE
jgi:hypothetical protein